MVRSRLAIAAALSLLLHLLLWFWLDTASIRRATPTMRAEPLELTWFEEPPPPPAARPESVQPVQPAAPTEAARPRKQRTSKAPPPPQGQPEGAERGGSPGLD
ncbi:MAG: hypothetical protein WBV82_33290, partial [Myxococcaceae bacterium]